MVNSDVEEGVVTMCLISGIFVIGRLKTEKVGEFTMVSDLLYPRIWHLIKNGAEQEMFPLPGCPLSVKLPQNTFLYPVPLADKQMHGLYEKVTKVYQNLGKATEGGAGATIVTPGMVKSN